MTDTTVTHPVWQEIYLDAFAHNIAQIRSHVDPRVRVCAVIKANAYGHGSIQVAQTLLDNGADTLAVAFVEEGAELRKAGINAPILILGTTEPSWADDIVKYDLMPAVYTLDVAQALSEAAQRAGREVKVHIKVDTGMGRIGLLPVDESIDLIAEMLGLPGIVFEGLFTHFSSADESDKSYTRAQFDNYEFFRTRLAERGLVPNVAHVANSAATIDLPEYHLDMVRVGIILYGVMPSSQVRADVLELRPTMALKARVVNVKDLEQGKAIGYRRRFVTSLPQTRIATLPIGYADGFTRLLSGKAEVLVAGRRVPVVGIICMDQCMIDVTGMDVEVGDEVTLIGRAGDDEISAEDVADKLGTIGYEVLCAVARRVPRIYLRDGEVVTQVNYLLD